MRVPPATLGQLTSLPWIAPPSPPTSSASRVTAVRVEASERVTPKPSATSSSTAPAAARVTVLVDAPWRPPLLLMLRCTRCLCSAWRCRGHTCGRAGRWRLPRLSLPLLPQPLLLVLLELLQLLLLLLQLLLLKLRLLLVLMLCCIGSICRTRRRRGRVSCGTGGWRLLLLLLPLMHCCTCRWCLPRRRPSRQRPATAAKDGTTSQPRGRWLVRPRANPRSGRPPPSQSSPNPARSAGDHVVLHVPQCGADSRHLGQVVDDHRNWKVHDLLTMCCRTRVSVLTLGTTVSSWMAIGHGRFRICSTMRTARSSRR